MIAADMFRYPITCRERPVCRSAGTTWLTGRLERHTGRSLRPSTKTVVNFFFQRAHDKKGLPRG